ncbi:uncharacterized protein LOC129311687 isoform X2 [Prosopis cineraria]|uniref:uncharacterized protein LOC129311687 isoform X2 n=1 Tax=Prosopis cineraria TaxID=364024 RepID=UPI00240F105B|nr:uncharacterized protein LOC129311687 isoform X2 [Prosopis cineraria]
MDAAEEELERRSKFLNSLIQKKKAVEQQEHHDRFNVRLRACDMPLPLQNRAFRCAREHLDSMPGKKLDSKRLALALKKASVCCFLFHWKVLKLEDFIKRVAIFLSLALIWSPMDVRFQL